MFWRGCGNFLIRISEPRSLSAVVRYGCVSSYQG